MANAFGDYPSPSSWLEFDHSLELERSTSSKVDDTLLDVAGCEIVISHERWLLNRIATHILAFEGDSSA